MASRLKPPMRWESFGQTLEIAWDIFRHAVVESSFIGALFISSNPFGLATLSPCPHPWPGYEHDLTYNSAGLVASCFCATGPHWPVFFPHLTDEARKGTLPNPPDGTLRQKR